MRKFSEKNNELYWVGTLSFWKLNIQFFITEPKKKQELINEKIKKLFKFKSKNCFKVLSLIVHDTGSGMISINDLPYIW